MAVLDIDMPGIDGLTAAEHLHEEIPSCRTLMLTGLGQPGHLLRALKAHVRGFILRTPPRTLADGVRRVSAGQRASTPAWWRPPWRPASSPLTAARPPYFAPRGGHHDDRDR